ncbi:uncharacterized protein SCHCODRAFT_02441758, partial [Schizophyllum commune H4-8]|uniref:uncharacterized protein n=1 Tax=Schizophyllum commune (strain H4-8 / FGSC 9210) TaxID=578458 RepID=UPI00215E0DBC
ERTVFEAELVGASLAVDIIASTKRLTKAAILLDSQAAIQALRGSGTKAGQQLVYEFWERIHRLRAARRTLSLTVAWVPGHVGVEGNERVDAEAKAAAEGRGGTPLHDKRGLLDGPLPVSRSAIIAAERTRVQQMWHTR